MSDEIVGLLQADMPPARLGALLRAARKRRGWKRKQAGAHTGVSAEKLRAYERGTKPVPADVCARLAECYGEALTAHVPVRTPVRVTGDWLKVGDYEQPLMSGSPDEILTGYVKIIQRLRHVKKGDPLPLRAADVHVLAAALMQDRDDVERRLAEVLGCSREEARALHGELLRRKVVLPVAGLAAGIAAIAGVAHAGAEPASPPAAPVAHEAPASAQTPDTTAPPVVHLVAVPATEAPTPTTEAPAALAPAAPTPSTEVAMLRTMQIVPVAKPAAPEAQPQQHETDATVPESERPADAPIAGIAAPQPDPHDVSILPGEHPYKIIGEPTSDHS